MFYDDALTASKELEITLTGKIADRRNGRQCAAFLFIPVSLISTS